MFNVNTFLNAINSSNFTNALALLREEDGVTLREGVTAGLGHIDEETKRTLLHTLAESPELNEALTVDSTRENALAIMQIVLAHVDLSVREKSTKHTALMHAIDQEHTAIAQSIITHIGTLEKSEQRQRLHQKDSEGRTALHHAVNCQDPLAIDALAKLDHKQLFIHDNHWHTPLALSMQCYKANPSDESIGIVNQVYFTHHPEERTDAVEANVSFNGDLMWYPLWKYGVYFCFQRDAYGRPTAVDQHFLDLVLEVINQGLVVWGIQVRLGDLSNWVDMRNGTKGLRLYQEAIRNNAKGKVGRTLGQTRANSVLAKMQDFADRAKQDAIMLTQVDADPKSNPKVYRNDTVVLWMYDRNDDVEYADEEEQGNTVSPRLFYAAKNTRKLIEIHRHDLDPQRQSKFDRLVQHFPAVGEESIKADLEQRHLFLPLMPASAVSTTPSASSSSANRMRTFGRGNQSSYKLFQPAGESSAEAADTGLGAAEAASGESADSANEEKNGMEV